MGFGSQNPRGGPGSVDFAEFEEIALDPTVAPGLPRPVGWRVGMPDGSAAWDKFGPNDADWSAVGAGGGGGGAPGTATYLTKLNHTGVLPNSIPLATLAGRPGLLAVANDGTPSIAALGAFASISVAGIATGATQLTTVAAAASTGRGQGLIAWVASVGDFFVLRDGSALTVDNKTVVTASGRAGAQWLRLGANNPTWAAQAAWTVNTSTGSDENAGSGAAPLLTVTELARRLGPQVLSTAISVTLVGNMAASDTPVFLFRCNPSGSFTFTGTPTVIYTGTVTTYTPPTPAPSTTDYELVDSTLPVSFTASGLLANNVIGVQGAKAFWFAKDLGAKTARISKPPSAISGTYTASTLPTIRLMRFADPSPFGITLSLVATATPFENFNDSVFFDRCFLTQPLLGGGAVLNNCAVQGQTVVAANPGNTYPFIIAGGGMVRGSGGQWIGLTSVQTQIIDSVTFQGAGLLVQQGFCLIGADQLIYDFTGVSAAAIGVSYWGIIFWSVGALQASNITNLIFLADRFAQIGYLTSPIAVAASSPAPTPVQISGRAALSIAALTAGGGAVDATQNGIFNSP